MGEVLGDREHEAEVRQGPQADMFLLHQWIKNEPVDLLIGNTYGKYISRDEDIPSSATVFRSSIASATSTSPRSVTSARSGCWNRSLNAFMSRQDRDSSPEAEFRVDDVDVEQPGRLPMGATAPLSIAISAHHRSPVTRSVPATMGRLHHSHAKSSKHASARSTARAANRSTWQCEKQSLAGVGQPAGLRVLRFARRPVSDRRRDSSRPRADRLCRLHLGHSRLAVVGTGVAPAELLHRSAREGRDLRWRAETLRGVE